MSSKVKTADMKKDGKTQLTPRLRFPEFQDAGGWEGSPLGDLLDYQQPTDYLVADTKYSDMYKTPVLTAGKTFILGYTNEQHGIFRDNLPVIIFDDFTTATQFVDFPFKAKSSAMKILQAKNRANIKFMYEIVQMIAYEVGAHERHWISKFAPMSILVPRPNEQQKIADCLTSVDDLIAAQARKVDALKTHKKGLMQNLFPREGETQPRLRFPEFRDTPGWEKKSLDQVADVTAGQSPSSANYNDIGTGTPFYQGKTDFGEIFINSPTKWTTQVTKIARQGDILMSVRAPVGALNIATDRICIGRGLASIQAKQNKWFLYYFLLRNQRFIIGNGGSVFDSISKDQIEKIGVGTPSTLAEQQKIADCLSSLDELISTQTQKLDTLKTHKRGLMQQLFPSPKDVDA